MLGAIKRGINTIVDGEGPAKIIKEPAWHRIQK
jgi:hypothetical protein